MPSGNGQAHCFFSVMPTGMLRRSPKDCAVFAVALHNSFLFNASHRTHKLEFLGIYRFVLTAYTLYIVIVAREDKPRLETN